MLIFIKPSEASVTNKKTTIERKIIKKAVKYRR